MVTFRMWKYRPRSGAGYMLSLQLLLMSVVLLSGCSVSGDERSSDALGFDMPAIKAPVFAGRTFTITDFGAVGDGHTLNTVAFAKTIQACVNAGGGRVVVPAGLWLTGPIGLKSNIDLHLSQGAVILFSPDIEHYPLKKTTFEGLESVRCTSPLSGENLENIAITGDGIIDGFGQVWRPVKKSKLTDGQWKALVSSGGVLDAAKKIWYPSEKALNGPETVRQLNQRHAEPVEYTAAGEFLRPVMVSLVNCKNVLLDGPTFQNSPSWNIHPLLCEDMIIRNINVRNPWWSQNGDGLDLESCRNVLIYNCRFDVGDDAMCMKSGKNEYGRRRGRPTENVAIWDCTVYHGHGGFVIGSEMSGGVRNISVRNCEFLGTDVGLRFKSTRGRGGVVENIYIEDIRMMGIATDAIRFNMFYAIKSPGPEQSLEIPPDPISEETPRFQNIYLKNIVCSGAESAIYMQGLPEMPVQKIEMENVVITAKTGVTAIEADQVTFKNVAIIPEEGASFMLYNGRNFTIEKPASVATGKMFMELVGDKTATIRLKGADVPALIGNIEYGKGTDAKAIVRD